MITNNEIYSNTFAGICITTGKYVMFDVIYTQFLWYSYSEISNNFLECDLRFIIVSAWNASIWTGTQFETERIWDTLLGYFWITVLNSKVYEHKDSVCSFWITIYVYSISSGSSPVMRNNRIHSGKQVRTIG